jgi:hypothetical protein
LSGASYNNAIDDHRKVLVHEQNVGRILGNVGGSVNRYASICLSQGNSIVNAISKHPHNFSLNLQAINDLPLLDRRQFGENFAVFDHFVKIICVFQFCQLGACNGFGDFIRLLDKIKVTADFQSNTQIVALSNGRVSNCSVDIVSKNWNIVSYSIQIVSRQLVQLYWGKLEDGQKQEEIIP